MLCALEEIAGLSRGVIRGTCEVYQCTMDRGSTPYHQDNQQNGHARLQHPYVFKGTKFLPNTSYTPPRAVPFPANALICIAKPRSETTRHKPLYPATFPATTSIARFPQPPSTPKKKKNKIQPKYLLSLANKKTRQLIQTRSPYQIASKNTTTAATSSSTQSALALPPAEGKWADPGKLHVRPLDGSCSA